MSEESGNKRAPEGSVYVCGACGKVSRWRYGFDSANGKNDASSGWDESCAMNSGLVPEAAFVEPYGWRYPQRVRRVPPLQKEVSSKVMRAKENR